MRPIEVKEWITVADVRAGAAVNKVFIFGDNLIRRGRAGQAVIRDEPNTIGIPTKRLPSMAAGAFFGVNPAEEKAAITEAIERVIRARQAGAIIVMPATGVGTGLAKLQDVAPEVFRHLQAELRRAGL